MEKENNDIVIDQDGRHFNYYVAGVLSSNNFVLLHNSSDSSAKYTLIGGKVKFGESAATALKREFLEETGQTITVGPLIKVMDHKVATSTESWQQLLLIFAVKCPTLNNSKTPQGFTWVPKDSLSTVDLKPNIFTQKHANIYSSDFE